MAQDKVKAKQTPLNNNKSKLSPILKQGNNIDTGNAKASDTDDDIESNKDDQKDEQHEFRSFPAPSTTKHTITNRKGIKLDTPPKIEEIKEGEISLTMDESSGSYEEKKYDGYHNNHSTNTNSTYKFPILVQ
eukprot:CAMPEP_0201593638 /NCGR_PEP_ID=MMETSP0190_2-20130828/191181_1 /ASSEMBLY_ACC=CAM_ASM_000263 /TAXON_ID=37353 /ORGANISM="Rosalina sp." /LENGTH=131 /DNA_ID=CAMNT_0048052905 /DNA_START=1290 /DNA_END=1685 /DNA_ORIENTATION=-